MLQSYTPKQIPVLLRTHIHTIFRLVRTQKNNTKKSKIQPKDNSHHCDPTAETHACRNEGYNATNLITAFFTFGSSGSGCCAAYTPLHHHSDSSKLSGMLSVPMLAKTNVVSAA